MYKVFQDGLLGTFVKTYVNSAIVSVPGIFMMEKYLVVPKMKPFLLKNYFLSILILQNCDTLINDQIMTSFPTNSH